MPKFGKTSLEQRKTLCKELQQVFDEVIKTFDFTITEGFRDKAAQDIAYAKGLSKVRWPNGKHNKKPSDAADIYPWPIDWTNKEANTQRSVYLAGYVMCTAERLGIQLRWGGDWNGDKDTRDEKFRDLGHFEVVRGAE